MTFQPISAATSSKEQFAQAYAVLRRAIIDEAFPGCAFGMIVKGQTVLQDALGTFTYDGTSPFVHPSTVYDIASITKVAATTAMAMLLWQRGELDLDTPLGDILPGFVVGRDPAQHARLVTIRHLLGHSSGLPGYAPLFHTAISPADVLRGCLELPLQVEPGTRAAYSDPGFILLGKALETIVNEDLATWTAREIFAPLRMSNTGYLPSPQLRLEIPPTEDDELFRQRRIQGEVQDEHAYLLKGVAGHAGVFSNVPDLLTFAHSILNPGPNALFLPDSVNLFAQRQPPPGSSRALGWDTPSADSSSGKHFSANSIGHLGYSGCSLWIDRDAHISIVLLTNRTWPHRESQLIRTVRPEFHDALREAL